MSEPVPLISGDFHTKKDYTKYSVTKPNLIFFFFFLISVYIFDSGNVLLWCFVSLKKNCSQCFKYYFLNRNCSKNKSTMESSRISHLFECIWLKSHVNLVNVIVSLGTKHKRNAEQIRAVVPIAHFVSASSSLAAATAPQPTSVSSTGSSYQPQAGNSKTQASQANMSAFFSTSSVKSGNHLGDKMHWCSLQHELVYWY